MTVNRTPINSMLLRGLMLVLLLTGFSVNTASAQGEQEYKRTYNAALEAARAKDYDQAYDLFIQAADQAQQAGDTDVAAKASKVVAQLDYSRGKNLLASDQAEQALTHFEKGIARYPQFADNYLGKALALDELGRTDEAFQVFENAMKSSDPQVAAAAREGLRDRYVYQASTALTRNGTTPTRSDAQEAIEHLNKALEYGTGDADVFYYLGEAHKALGDYDKAISYADQALAIHNGSRSDKAKIYYMKGEALMNLGNNAAAKQAFSEATYGSYKASAEHYIETL